MNAIIDSIPQLSKQRLFPIQLQRLDLLLHRQILRLRQRYQLSLDEFRGLYISDQQVDELIDIPTREASNVTGCAELNQQSKALQQDVQQERARQSVWHLLTQRFALSEFEQDVLLLAFALDLDIKYESLFAYLNNDITSKYPTCELALALFSDGLQGRDSLQCNATLFRLGLLVNIEHNINRPSWLGRGFYINPFLSQSLTVTTSNSSRINGYLRQDFSSTTWQEVPLAQEIIFQWRNLKTLLQTPSRQSKMLYIKGKAGSGGRRALFTLAAKLDKPILSVALNTILSEKINHDDCIKTIVLQQALYDSIVYIHGIETTQFVNDTFHFIQGLIAELDFVALRVPENFTSPQENFDSQVLSIQCTTPDVEQRCKLWRQQLSCLNLAVGLATNLADSFELTPRQIEATMYSASATAVMEGEVITTEHMFAAARQQTAQQLLQLATVVETQCSWHDLKLSPAVKETIFEIKAAVQHRHVVYEKWGFGRRSAYGHGLKVLFSGSSGTGKTMTASVIAKELGLSLYKIDLSGIVSKYIGETQKNLDRIFSAAQGSNAIIFFDEADALFGKRSEVKDAHDRYANIESAYLLQKMEDYNGVVMLATNLSKNIDQAFMRRLHFIVDFPMPNDVLRLALWRGIFGDKTPLADDVDLEFLAKQFRLAGGDIRNVALNAAFLAAENKQAVNMKHLLKAISRQMIKQGKIPSATEFKHYYQAVVKRV